MNVPLERKVPFKGPSPLLDTLACKAYNVHDAMSRSYPTYLLLALTLASLAEARSAHAQERYLYWVGAVQAEETRTNTIFRYTLDTGVVDTLVQAKDLSPDTWRFFSHVTVDTLGRHIYWTDSGGTLPDGTVYIGAIMRASLDGDNPEIFLGGIICGIGGLTDIELDLVGETLYWGEGSDCPFVGLHSIDLATYQWQRLPTTGNYSVSGIELDIDNEMIYWTNTDFFFVEPHGILRAPLNDTTSEEYIVTGSACDIALAHTLS